MPLPEAPSPPPGFHQHIRARAKVLLNNADSAQLEVHQSDLTYDTLVTLKHGVGEARRTSRDEADRAAEDPRVLRFADATRHLKILSSDGKPLLYVMRSAMREVDRRGGKRGKKGRQAKGDEKAAAKEGTVRPEGPHKPAKEDKLHKAIAAGMREFGKPVSRRLPDKKVHDHRYRDEHEDEYLERNGRANGFCTKSLGMWHAQAQNEEWDPVHITKDTLRTSADSISLRHLLRQITMLWTVISILFDVLEPKAAQLYQEAFDRHRKDNLFADLVNNVGLFFMTVVLVMNRRVAPHYDAKDALHGWATMSVFRSFTGGDLFLPDLGVRIAYRVGDVVLFKSALLRHSILPFHGQRYSLVAFTHLDLLVDSPSNRTVKFFDEWAAWDSTEILRARHAEGVADAKAAGKRHRKAVTKAGEDASRDTIVENAETSALGECAPLATGVSSGLARPCATKRRRL